LKAAGFSLIEVLVATAVVAVGVASLAQLIVVSAHANRIAMTTSISLLLAEQKMEELLGDPGDPGDPRTESTQDHVDYLGPSGGSLGRTTISGPSGTPPLGTAYVCRWSIAPLPDSPGTAIVIQVSIAPWPDISGQTRLVSVKTRKGS